MKCVPRRVEDQEAVMKLITVEEAASTLKVVDCLGPDLWAYHTTPSSTQATDKITGMCACIINCWADCNPREVMGLDAISSKQC